MSRMSWVMAALCGFVMHGCEPTEETRDSSGNTAGGEFEVTVSGFAPGTVIGDQVADDLGEDHVTMGWYQPDHPDDAYGFLLYWDTTSPDGYGVVTGDGDAELEFEGVGISLTIDAFDGAGTYPSDATATVTLGFDWSSDLDPETEQQSTFAIHDEQGCTVTIAEDPLEGTAVCTDLEARIDGEVDPTNRYKLEAAWTGDGTPFN